MSLLRKSLLLILLLPLTVALADKTPTKIVLHVNDSFKLGHLRNSVKNIRQEMGDDTEIKVVVNGKAVTRFLKSNVESTKVVESILKQDVSIGICHNAVINNRVKKSMLIEGLEVLESGGNVTIINYQRDGYLYIKL